MPKKPKEIKPFTALSASQQGRRRELPDADNPEWTDKMFAQAETLQQALPELYARAKSAGGRPKAAQTKQKVMLRLDPDIVARFKGQGAGWMTRMNEALKQAAQSLPPA